MWKHSILIASLRSLAWIALAVLLTSLWSNADKQRKTKILSDGRIEFSPSKYALWASFLYVSCLVYGAIEQIRHAHGNSFNYLTGALLGIMAAMVFFSLPGTIVVTGEGLEQVFWFRRNKHIRWADIVEINTGEKIRTIKIIGADGTKISHSSFLADRPRLLMELKQHCGENLPSDFPREPIASL
jgi:Bacterial PH domain